MNCAMALRIEALNSTLADSYLPTVTSIGEGGTDYL